MSGKAPGVGLICELAEDGDIVEIKRVFMNMPYLIDVKDDEGKSPLHSACDYGHTEVAHEFISRGADVNAMTKSGTTPLHWASRGGYTDVITMLLEQNAYINVQNKFGWAPLHWACYKGHLDVIEMLLDAQADINIRNELENTPLHFLLHTKHVGKEKHFEDGYADFILKVVDESKADLNLKNKDGWTLLHCVCEVGHLQLVKAFVERNALVNSKTKNNETPVFVALNNGHEAVAEYLVIKGAVIHAEKDDYSWEPGHTQWGGPERAIKPGDISLGLDKQQVIKAVKEKYNQEMNSALAQLENA